MNESTCPTAYEFQQMLDGEISDQRLEELGAHLEQCATCNQLLRKIPDDNVRRAFRNYHAIDGSDILIQQAILKAQSIFKARSEGTEQDTVRSALDETLSAEQPTQQFTFLAVPQLPDEIGRLGKYRILGVLGQGGMGLVFRANDPTLARDVALKVLWMAKPISTAVRQRFAREAKALASIDHDNVVPVHSVEEDRGVPFLTMKLLSGQPLSDMLADLGKLRPPETLRIARQVAAALSAAHAKGVIHRDIKPSNIWIEESGKVRLIDFGLALTNDLELTNTGDVLGTPKYMSPEQANGQPVSESSDLFSLGCVMYHCLSGAAPFEADSVVAVLRKIADGDYQELYKVDPKLDRRLVDVVEKLLRVGPDQRFATASELDIVLACIDARLSQPTPQPEPAPAEVALPSGFRNGGSRWTGKSLALAALLPLGFIAIAAVMISFKFRDGSTVVLTIDGGPDTTKLDVGEDRLSITDPNDGKTIEVSVDHARHQLRFEKEGFAAVGTEYDLSTPDGRKINIRFEAEQLGTSPVSPAGKVSQREIAEWVLRVGGRLFLADTEVTDASQITESMPPISAVYLVSLELSDRDVSILSGINSPVALFLQNIPITGECLQDISRLNLRILQLYACTNFDPTQLKYLEGHPTLTDVSAVGTNLGDEFAKVAATLANLQILNLADGATGDSLRLIGGCKNIVELSTWPTLGIRPFDFKGIVQLPNLKRLYLNYEQFGRQTVEAINQCPLLTSLDIADYDGQGELNIELVGQLQKIESLSVTGTDLSFADLKVLGKIPKLRSLVLRYTQLSPEQLPDLATLSNLRFLELTHVGPSSDELFSAEQLSELAKQMPECKIQSLPVRSSQREIAERVLKLGGRVLLADTEITDPSQISEPMPPISAIYFTDVQVNDDDLNVLGGINSEMALFLQNVPITGECIQQIRKIALSYLYIHRCKDFEVSNLKYLEGHPTLWNLDGGETKLGDEFARVAGTIPTLRTLGLPDGATGESLREIRQNSDGITDLTTSSTNGISPVDFKEIVGLSKLTRLHINREQFGRETVEAINQCPALTFVSLALYDGRSDSNIELLAQLQRIESLEIWHTDLSHADLKMLGRMPNLKELYLGYATLLPEQLHDLAGLSNLRSLELSHVGNSSSDLLSDEQLAELAKLMPNCKIQSQDWSSETQAGSPE